MYEECAKLAYYHHIDMMLYVVFLKGHYLGLQKALEGIGNPGKLHDVILNDGKTILYDMSGKLAPVLWKQGEFNAVLTYLNYDVTEPLSLLQYIYMHQKLQWISKAGNFQVLPIFNICNVFELYDTLPDHQNWVKFNISRTQFISWMPISTFIP
jgi:hypothetical protein